MKGSLKKIGKLWWLTVDIGKEYLYNVDGTPTFDNKDNLKFKRV